MRCAISSRAGQVLAKGSLGIKKDENGEMRLFFQSDAGSLIVGGIISDDGNLTPASQELFRQFFQAWGMSDLTLTAKAKM